MATKKMMEELVPYEKVPLGFEAVFTGRKRSPDSKEIDIITTLYGDEAGNEVRQWPVFSWT